MMSVEMSVADVKPAATGMNNTGAKDEEVSTPATTSHEEDGIPSTQAAPTAGTEIDADTCLATAAAVEEEPAEPAPEAATSALTTPDSPSNMRRRSTKRLVTDNVVPPPLMSGSSSHSLHSGNAAAGIPRSPTTRKKGFPSSPAASSSSPAPSSPLAVKKGFRLLAEGIGPSLAADAALRKLTKMHQQGKITEKLLDEAATERLHCAVARLGANTRGACHTIHLARDSKGSFGFGLGSSAKVGRFTVESVSDYSQGEGEAARARAGAAGATSLRKGDEIMQVSGKVVLGLERESVLTIIKAAGATLSLKVLRPDLLPPTAEQYLGYIISKSADTDPVGMKLVTVKQGEGEQGWATFTLCEGLVKGGLAEKSGVQAGDVIKEVNGLSTFGQSHDIVMRTIRQTAGKLLLVVLRIPVNLRPKKTKKTKKKEEEANADGGNGAAEGLVPPTSPAAAAVAAVVAAGAAATAAAAGAAATAAAAAVAATAAAGARPQTPLNRVAASDVAPDSPGWQSPSAALPTTRADTPDEAAPTRRPKKQDEAADAASSLSRRFTVYDKAAKVPKSVSVMARLRSGSTSIPAVLAVSEMNQGQADSLLLGKTNGAYLFREARGVIVLSMMHNEKVSHHQLKMPMNISFSDLNKKLRKFVKQFSATKSGALPCVLREYVTDDGKGPRVVPKASSLAEKAAAAKAKAAAATAAKAVAAEAEVAAAADPQGWLAATADSSVRLPPSPESSRSPSSFGKFHQSSLASFGSLRKQHGPGAGAGAGAAGMLSSKPQKMGSSVMMLAGLDDGIVGRNESQVDEDGLPFSPSISNRLDEDGLPSASPVPSSLPGTPQNGGNAATPLHPKTQERKPTMLKEATSAKTQLALNSLKELDAEESTENGESPKKEAAPPPAKEEKKPRRKLVRGGNKQVTPVLAEFTSAINALDDLDGFLNKYEEMNSEILNFDGPNVKEGALNQDGDVDGDAAAADKKTSFFSRMSGKAKGGADFTTEDVVVPAAAVVGKSAYGQMFDTLF